MNVLDHFPDAHLIEARHLQAGDVIAYTPAGQADSFCVSVFDHHGPGGQKMTSGVSIIGPTANGFHLIRRPSAALPNEQGDMVRVLNSQRSAFTYPGNVFVLKDEQFRCYETGNKLYPEDFERYGITWEQVWYTNMGPDCEGIVDAEVLDDDGDDISHNLIELTSGMYKGALLRYHEPSNHFRGMDPEGNPLSLTHATVDGSDWIAAALTRGI